MKSSTSRSILAATCSVFALTLIPNSAQAVTLDLSIRGTDVIYLAGRDDISVPVLGDTFELARHGFIRTDFQAETFPQLIEAVEGQEFSFSAEGCVHFFNGIGCPNSGFGPDGNGTNSDLLNLDGISGYRGPQGPLAGVFLNDVNPRDTLSPSAGDFTSSGNSNGTDFITLKPALGQVFFIGDGQTSTGITQSFVAPAGTTRLFLGIPDGFSFRGQPGAYEDNDGTYEVAVTFESPTADTSVPEPSMFAGLLAVCSFLRFTRQRMHKVISLKMI